MSDSDDTINSAYALAQKSKREAENTSYTPPPGCEEAHRVLEFLKAIRALTKDWFASVLEDRGIGHFHQSSDRPFNRNLLFIKSEVGNVFQIYTPCWLDEIKKCHLQLWSAADNDPEVKELYSYVQSFKHEWEDFFQTLSNQFRDAADNLLSDFETAGLQMFGNLDASISYAHARTPDAETDHNVFLDYLPEVKKLFIRASEKSTLDSNSPLNFDDACHRLHEEEMKSRKDRWLKFRDLLLEAGLTIPIEEWPIPTDWNSKNVNLIYAHLLEQINWSLNQIRNSSNPMTPQDNWESLLPEVFSFDLGRFAFSQTETYDDGIYRTVTLKDGSTINISKSSDSSYITYPPRDQCVAALEEYIREGVRISRLINSTSNRTWRKAEAKFQNHRTLINLPISYHAMKELGEFLHDARIELTLDIEDYITKNSPPKRNAHSNKRKGSGLRGTRTKMMREQFEGFCEFLKTNPICEIGQGKTVGARAIQFWGAHKKTFERATKAIGEKHGYPNAKAIASAYRASKN